MRLLDGNRGSYPILQAKWSCPNRRFSKYIVTINCMHTNNREEHLRYQTIVLYVWNFADVCDINFITLEKRTFSTESSRKRKCVLVVIVRATSTTFASGNRTVLILTTNLSDKSIMREISKFLSLYTLSWVAVCYFAGLVLNDIVMFWKTFYGWIFQEMPLSVSHRILFQQDGVPER